MCWCLAFQQSGGDSNDEFKAQLQHLSGSNATTITALHETATAIVKPAVEWYFTAVLGPKGHLKDQLRIYEAARIISPQFLAKQTVDQCMAHIDTLRTHRLLSEEEVKDLSSEVPQVIHELAQHPVGPETTTVAYWKQNKERFPKMCMLLRKIASLCQTSAGAERVFSLLDQLFTAQQEASALGDYLEVALMCRYNFG